MWDELDGCSHQKAPLPATLREEAGTMLAAFSSPPQADLIYVHNRTDVWIGHVFYYTLTFVKRPFLVDFSSLSQVWGSLPEGKAKILEEPWSSLALKGHTTNHTN